jgi:integrase
MGLADARKAASAMADGMRAGIDPAGAKRAAKAKAIANDFAAVAAEWLERDQADNRSRANVARSLAKDVTPLFRGRPIETITTDDALAAINAIVDRGTVTQARRTFAYLHRLFRWAVSTRKMSSNPLAGVDKPGAERSRDRVLSDRELGMIWRAAGAIGWPFGPVVKLLMLTGARLSEIGSLQWQEIDGDAIRLSGDRTKNGEAFTLPLSTAAVAIVADLPRIEDADFVFTVTGRTPVSGWSKAKLTLDAKILEAMRESDPEAKPFAPWRFHDLRRSAATGMGELEIPPNVIEATLNHVSGSRGGVAGVYNKSKLESAKRAALETWGQHLTAAISTDSASPTT